MRPVCVSCRTEMKPHKTGITVIEISKDGPHRLWRADLSRCPGCQFEIITGYATYPHAEYFHSHFDGELLKAREHPEMTYEVHCI